MKTAESEIDNAVREAYAEGYKTAMLQYAPEIAALRIKESALEEQIKKERKKNIFFGLASGVSFAAGFLIHGLLAR